MNNAYCLLLRIKLMLYIYVSGKFNVFYVCTILILCIIVRYYYLASNNVILIICMLLYVNNVYYLIYT